MDDIVLVYPKELPEGGAEMLASLGCVQHVVATNNAFASLPTSSVNACIVWADDANAKEFCLSLCEATSSCPIIVIGQEDATSALLPLAEFFEDFILAPFSLSELRVRLTLAFNTKSSDRLGDDEAAVTYGPLMLDSTTFQATVAGRALDLTYLEYELLKFLVSSPGQVFKRETLLSQVWGFDYYGGSRTVDVHIRRLRSKLGEEYGNLIQTVRSVGYKVSKDRWIN